MKGGSSGLIKFILSISIMLLLHFFYFKVFNTTKISYDVARLIEYILGIISIYLIYRKELKNVKPGYGRGFLNTIIYSLSCFIFLIVITFFITRWLNIDINLINYFKVKANVLTIIEEVVFIPFLLSAILVLGVSLISKGKITPIILSGICAGVVNSIVNGFSVNIVLPIITVTLLQILYRTSRNIWTVMLSYSMYLLFGALLITRI